MDLYSLCNKDINIVSIYLTKSDPLSVIKLLKRMDTTRMNMLDPVISMSSNGTFLKRHIFAVEELFIISPVKLFYGK